jgi:hypothetical protein
VPLQNPFPINGPSYYGNGPSGLSCSGFSKIFVCAPIAPKIEPITDGLKVVDNVAAALGDAASLLGMAYFDRIFDRTVNDIVQKILSFGSTVIKAECNQPSRPDVAEFQIVVAFHQTL